MTYTQILGVVCDNGGGNDLMVEQLEHLLPGFHGKDSHVRCLAHVINLSSGVSVVFTLLLYAADDQYIGVSQGI